MPGAFVRYSRDYVTQVADAKTAGLGVHGHGCKPAWEYRVRLREIGKKEQLIAPAVLGTALLNWVSRLRS